VLHLIASHHGWSGPYFPPRAFDRRALRASEATAQACIQRFGRLQKRYGPWGLAYLEAIFKAADGLVSKSEQE
jgi:CRISPR-associated endonuclease/helicase Cas3